MIVLGIDPGSVRTGWAVLESSGARLLALDWGRIVMSSSQPFHERLVRIHDGLAGVISDHRPDCAAVESIFQSGVQHNVASVLKLGQARGVALLAVAQAGLPLNEYPPADVKKSLVGNGRADKWQMQQMVKGLLRLAEAPPEDAADALAVAVCHAFRQGGRLPGGIG